MVTVKEASQIISANLLKFGSEKITLSASYGRILAEDILADRDMPPYDRVTMDGYAIRYSDYLSGQKSYPLQATQIAGKPPLKLEPNKCLQVMTGAVLPLEADSIVPVEDTISKSKIVTLSTETIDRGQFIHRQGSDARRSDKLVPKGQAMNLAEMSLAASVGLTTIAVSKLPRVVVITTGDELVDISHVPNSYQIRETNNFAALGVLSAYHIPVKMLHLADDQTIMIKTINDCLKKYDVIIVSGGVSKGSMDFVPTVLNSCGVNILFHGVKQKPGKPLLFGKHRSGTVIFACPGNPMSTSLCLLKYFVPWLRASLDAVPIPVLYATINRSVTPPKGLTYFVPASLKSHKDGVNVASPIDNNGSGDFNSLSTADVFLEFATTKSHYQVGTTVRTIPLGAA